jgi:two-component system alkaline phosphatase synthesis response regulator PhoP
MAKAKILVIDDEPSILNLVTAYLRSEGFEYQTAIDGPSGLKAARVFHPDLIVLDIMLPGMDGIELLNQLRRESNVYVIMLTARTEETDKIVGLSIGADDYMTKPFSPRELMARIKAALRRMQRSTEQKDRYPLVYNHIRIDPGSRKVWVENKEPQLTGMEFDLLYWLATQPGIVLTREQLLERIWGTEYFGDLRVVDVHIGHLRSKIGNGFIQTVRGVGFRFEDGVKVYD